MAHLKRGVVLAAGCGRRLGPRLANVAKPLLRCGGMSILERTLKQLAAFTKVREIVIVVGYRGDEVLRQVRQLDVVDGSLYVEFVHNADFSTTNSMYSLSLVRDFAAEGFWLIDGDVLLSDSAVTSVEALGADVVLLDTQRPLTQMDMRAEVRGNRIWHMDKTLPAARTMGEFFGVSKFGTETAQQLFVEISAYIESHGGSDWYELALRNVAKRIPIGWHEVGSDHWFEVDTFADYVEAERWALTHPALGSGLRDGRG